jgi:hypothetical protein
MDNQEAKRVLQTLRPGDPVAKQPPFSTALALADDDPDLKAWWEAQQAFDQKVAAKLQNVPLPADLRDNILAARKIEAFPAQPRFSYWLAAAAMVAILCLAGTVWENARHVSSANYDQAALAFLDHDAPPLGMTSADHDKILAWLKERNAPTGSLPAKMSTLPTVGCQKFAVAGHSVSLICFALAGGRLVHLFLVNQTDLSDPPSRTGPEFKEIQGWSTASWSDDKMSYMLATQASPDTLRQLL